MYVRLARRRCRRRGLPRLVRSLARGRDAAGLRDLIAYALGYGAQARGYLLLSHRRYPSSDPALAEPCSELPEHPVRIVVDGRASSARG